MRTTHKFWRMRWLSLIVLACAGAGFLANRLSGVHAAEPTGPIPSNKSIEVPVNAWTTFPAGGFPAEIVGYDATVYASAIKRHVVLGKYHHFSSEPNYCMDAWSWDENRWDILDCGAYWHTEHAMEGGHPVGAFVYMPKRASIVYWGGQSGSNQPEQAFHTWWWDVVGMAGRDKLGTNRPGNIKVSAMAYDESRDQAVFFPDAAFGTEIYDPAANQWLVAHTSGQSPPRGLTFSTMDWDSKNHLTYLYGGASGNSCNSGTLHFNPDVYTFDLASSHWDKLQARPDPVSGSPEGRWYAGFAYDPDDNIFLLAGGQKCSDAKPGATQIGLTDTWKLDVSVTPAQWTRLKPSADFVLRNSADAPFQKLRYDPDHHAFVMILPSYDNKAFEGGMWANYPARIWVYCYHPPCAAVGTAQKKYLEPAGSLNRRSQSEHGSGPSWASDTALAAGHGAVYLAAIESGSRFATERCLFHHPYVDAIRNNKLDSFLGLDCTALDSNVAKIERDGEKPSLAFVRDSLWASWSESNNAAAIPNTIFAKKWNGKEWEGEPIGTRNPPAKAAQGFSQLTEIEDRPGIAFIENNKTVFPDMTEAYVDQYDGKTWRAMGAKLNRNPNSRVESIAIAGPWTCWTEEVVNGWTAVSPSQLFCSHWEGPEWKPVGGALNLDPSQWAAEATVTMAASRTFVAWTERPTAGSAALYVKAWDGTKWSSMGSNPLNKGSRESWVFHPRLASNGQSVFLSWEEQPALGQHPQLHVVKWNGPDWETLGPALNVEAAGSASHSSIAILDGAPVVGWTEVQLGELQQLYAKKWVGSRWVAIEPGLLPGKR